MRARQRVWVFLRLAIIAAPNPAIIGAPNISAAGHYCRTKPGYYWRAEH
jgi:hypothetical protein